MSTRLQRVEAMLKRAIADQILMGNLRDPRLHRLSSLSITGVRVSADLSHAKIFVDINGSELDRQKILQGLQAAAPAIRHELRTHIQLKKLPQLHFEQDQSIQAGLVIEQVLAELATNKEQKFVKAGILLVDKPEGPTSHDIVAWVRWVLGLRQVGHCGTLDPAASGLLILCIGPATRMAAYFTSVDKCYEAKIVLGVSTDTWDRDGQICQTEIVPPQIYKQAPAGLQAMCGPLCLQPPIYSAIKKAGKRAFVSARQGKEVELEARNMHLYEVRDISLHEALRKEDQPSITATLKVSKGTYIRSIAVELGRRLEVPAHLAQLRRIACGGMELANQSEVLQVCKLTSHSTVEGSRQRWSFQLLQNVDEDQSSQDRNSLRIYLERQIIEAHRLLPIPTIHLSSEERSAYLFEHLLLGQAVSLPLSLVPLPLGVQQEICLVGQDFRSNAQTYIFVLAKADSASKRSTLRPKRVIRMDT